MNKRIVIGTAVGAVVIAVLAGVYMNSTKIKISEPVETAVSSQMVSSQAKEEVSTSSVSSEIVNPKVDSETSEVYGNTTTGEVAVKSENTASSAGSNTPAMSAKEKRVREGLKDCGYSDAEIEESITEMKKSGELSSSTSSKSSSSKSSSSKSVSSKPSTKNNQDYNYTGNESVPGYSEHIDTSGDYGIGSGGGQPSDGAIKFN